MSRHHRNPAIPIKLTPTAMCSRHVRRQYATIVLALCFTALPNLLWAACTVSTTSVSFGNYDVFSVTDLDSTGTVSVDCDTSTSYSIELSTGNGTFTTRQMINGANTLDYNLYTTSARTTVWGDGSGATATVDNTGTMVDHTVYGRIPAQQNAFIGSYSDTVVATLVF